ncbi:MAG: hypothetical protein M3R15_32870 [Acidobacteriota bacterium]|nr:hypothetical protein [Acidobacteriota bacterium]
MPSELVSDLDAACIPSGNTVVTCFTTRTRDSSTLEMGVPALPALLTANLRYLLRVALSLAQLTPAEAALSVVERLVRRARSIGSRLRAQTWRIDSS